ncbi:hypothetical protein AC578_7290 [Pseudocercospora eumusae]|uniref:Uncharacterized protein n=1 Tax=Pseudocercospora eumusae TaxID=321146 RepID=A0A139HWR8_9PEZI|nr:hypothetical protein AC578_7290 [Pseudocercospora eumusae]
MHSLTSLLALTLTLTLTPLSYSLDIQVFSGTRCTGASWSYSNLPAHYCLQTPPGIYSSSEMSAEFTNIEPGTIVYAYDGSEGNGACDYKNVRTHFTSTGPMNFWQCYTSFRYAAFAWDDYDPNVGKNVEVEREAQGVKGPEFITLVDGTQIEVDGMGDDDRIELWELAVNGLAKEELPANFVAFVREPE